MSERRLPPLAGEVLESLYQHRLLHTGQVQAIHAPRATRRWTQQLLAALARHGLITSVRVRGALKAWHLTQAGADTVEAIPTRAEPRRKLLTAAQAAGQLQAHTLAVNQVGIAYLQAARQRGDEYGPLSWRHEIAHPIGPAAGQRRSELVIADALITYLRTSADQLAVEQRFLELDRATLPLDALVAKLARYQRLHDHAPTPGRPPAWRGSYPAFPQIQIVLAHSPRPLLERRARLTLALYHADPGLSEQPDVRVSIALLEDLLAHGPFASIWLRADDPTRHVDWLGQPAQPRERRA